LFRVLNYGHVSAPLQKFHPSQPVADAAAAAATATHQPTAQLASKGGSERSRHLADKAGVTNSKARINQRNFA
jgi:hypothetical protein